MVNFDVPLVQLPLQSVEEINDTMILKKAIILIIHNHQTGRGSLNDYNLF